MKFPSASFVSFLPLATWIPTRRQIVMLVAVGLSLRAWHYLRGPSIWGDEAALIVNVLSKGFGELLGPLFFHEAAPPLFLWIEKTVCLVFGDGIYALRFIPFAASCAGMVLMPYVARRVVRAEAVGWVLLLFAVSDRLLHHACEAKQYALECLAGAVLLGMYVALRSWPPRRQLALHALLAPCLLWVCYSACFLYGGLLVALLPLVWRPGGALAVSAKVWLCYGLLVLAVFGSFGWLLMGPIDCQRDVEIVQCWIRGEKFPNWQRPWSLPLWSARSTLELVDYFCRPVGHVLAPVALVGLLSLWRRQGTALAAYLILPIALAFGSSLAMAYPFGGARVMCFCLPAIALLVGEGAPTTIAWLSRRHRLAAAALVLALFLPVGRTVWLAFFPWNRADSTGAANYVLTHRRPSDFVTGNAWDYIYLFRDLGPSFAPLAPGRLDSAAERMWVLITEITPGERERDFRAGVPPEWEIVEEHEFAKTDVYLMRRAKPVAALARSDTNPRRKQGAALNVPCLPRESGGWWQSLSDAPAR
ncbi:MAG TPA: hypothetical protein VMV69_14705 [Pirellulales bacterium]|nr:hypothetical protein [Pirellulales bacterium]